MAQQKRPAMKSNTLYVSGLDPSIVEVGIREEFSKYGEIERVTVIRDKVTRVSKGFAYVLCKTEEQAEAAMREMDGRVLMDKPIKVKYSHSSTPEWLSVLQNRGSLKEEATPFVPRTPRGGPGGMHGGRGGPGGMRGSPGSRGGPRGRGFRGRGQAPMNGYDSPRGRGGMQRGRGGPRGDMRGGRGGSFRGRGAPRGRGGPPSQDRGYLGYESVENERYDADVEERVPMGRRRGPPEDDLGRPPRGGMSGRTYPSEYSRQPADPYNELPPRAARDPYDPYTAAPASQRRDLAMERGREPVSLYAPRDQYRERSPVGRDYPAEDPYAKTERYGAPYGEEARAPAVRRPGPDPYAAQPRRPVADPYGDVSYPPAVSERAAPREYGDPYGRPPPASRPLYEGAGRPAGRGMPPASRGYAGY